MSAETIGQGEPRAAAWPEAPRRRGRAVRPVAGTLPDGTAYFAPIGEVIADESRIICHLCGRSLRSVAAHLTAHGWTKEQYCEAFGLERGQPLEGQETRKLRAAALTARLVFEPAIRAGSAAGRERARTGELTRDAAEAATGRPFPEQRRRKARKALATVPSAAVAQANRERADRHLASVAAGVARAHGYRDIQSFVTARLQEGASLAAISRAAGLHKDWLSRHLSRVDPALAATARRQGEHRHDAAWQPALHRLGFPDFASYLRERHLEQHLTVNAIAAEVSVSHHAVDSALRRHGLTRVVHAGKRHQAEQRARAVAAGLGFASIGEYVARRRASGLTWQAISAESGQPPTWLRRHAAGS